MKYLPYFLIALGIILIDQAIKLYIHATLSLGEEILIFGDWFKLHYTLNPGMAFGIKIGSDYGKLTLTVFRILAGFGIAAFIVKAVNKKSPVGFLFSMALILGGAFGNVVDSVFYGEFIEGNAVRYYGDTPPLYPWFHGKVIDMFYFDIASGYFPGSLPFIGGKHYSFFPIFNFADAAIFIGVCIILIYQKRFFPKNQLSDAVVEETIKENDQELVAKLAKEQNLDRSIFDEIGEEDEENTSSFQKESD